MKTGPLTGIKVVEIAGIGPGPCASMYLADMGAEVIMVERKTPNANLKDVLSSDADSRLATFNRGKRSVAVNLKDPKGVDIVLSLIEEADVFIEGFRPGVMERLGLGPDVCLQKNPKLIYGRMTGWGQTGPLSLSAGHDPNYISISGALWYAGRKDRAPIAPTTMVGDMAGGAMFLVTGILCGVIHANKTGEGQVIDAAITDGSAYLASLLWPAHNSGALQDELETSWVDGAAPWNETYKCADGKYVTICPVETKFYLELLERLGLSDDPTLSKQWKTSLWPKGKETLKALFLTKSRDQWCELLEGTDSCFSPVLNFSEAAKHPHNVARNTFLDIDGIIQPAPAPRFSVTQPTAGIPPTSIDAHTDEILLANGFDRQAIEELKRNGTV